MLMLTEAQRIVLFVFVLGVFAWQGYKRGFISEMVKFTLIVLGILVGNQPGWAKSSSA